MTVTHVPLAKAIEAVDPRSYGELPGPDDCFSWLRANCPLGKVRLLGVDPFWLVTRYADVLEVSRRNEVFSNGDGQLIFTTRDIDHGLRALADGRPHLLRTLAHMDAPDHPHYRQATLGWFTPQSLRGLDAFVRKLAGQQVAKLLAQGGAECMAEIVQPFPLQVIMHILGAPQEDAPLFARLTREISCPQDPDLNRTGETGLSNAAIIRQHADAVRDISAYFLEIVRQKRRRADDTLVSHIAWSSPGGAPISETDTVSYCVAIATAGHDTTAFSLGGGLWALCQDPGLLEALRADPSLVDAFVEETFRWTSPVKHFMRTARSDYRLGGQTIQAGDWLMLSYPSANHDEAEFPDPHSFRLDRGANKHLAFGGGGHMCIGRNLARMEMRAFFSALISTTSRLEFAGSPRLTVNNIVGGPKELPVRAVAGRLH